MKTSTKIKGILAMADISQLELAKLCGVTRQTIHNYLNVKDIEDYERGLKVMTVVDKLMKLCGNDTLPLPTGTDNKLETIQRLISEA